MNDDIVDLLRQATEVKDLVVIDPIIRFKGHRYQGLISPDGTNPNREAKKPWPRPWLRNFHRTGCSRPHEHEHDASRVRPNSASPMAVGRLGRHPGHRRHRRTADPVAPLYRTTATVFVRTPGDISHSMDGGDLYAQTRAETYAALAKSPGTAARVIADLGLDLSPAKLSQRIQARHIVQTALFQVKVSAPLQRRPAAPRRCCSTSYPQRFSRWKRCPAAYCRGPSSSSSTRHSSEPASWPSALRCIGS